MRRLIFYALAACTVVSCRISGPESPAVSDYTLISYSEILFNRHACNTCKAMDYALLLQKYVESDEEGRLSGEFDPVRETLYHIDDDTYYIENVGKFDSCGKDLLSQGAEWKIEYGDSRYTVSRTESGDSSWMVSYRIAGIDDVFTSPVSYTSEYGKAVWQLSVQGTERGEATGYRSEFSSGETPLYLCKETGSMTFYPVGNFDVDIYDGTGEPVDFCHAVFSYDKSIYKTSR